MYGLMPKGNEPLVRYAIRMLIAINNINRKRGDRTAEENNYFKLAHDFKSTFSTRDCKPWFVGVWDTVSSVGWYENPLRLPYSADNPDIEIGRQAISIDERRAFFRANLWVPRKPPPESGPKNLKQVWFPGVHSDVGGGYPEPESGLSKIALQWMLAEAIEAGLLVDPRQMELVLGKSGGGYAPPDPKAVMHESLKGFWWLAEVLWKRHFSWKRRRWEHRFNLGRRRTIPPKSLIHQSAYERDDDYENRLPTDGVVTT
jgi:uncharacterized protein (DUF2235 family)